MTNLSDKKCEDCESSILHLGKEKVDELFKQLNNWTLHENHIEKEFTFNDFKDALKFTNKVGKIAEQEGHHPDIFLTWGKVKIKLWTHSINGLSKNDFILATKIDKI